MHDLLAGASLPHAPPLPPPPTLAGLPGVGWALRSSGETVPPPRRAAPRRAAPTSPAERSICIPLSLPLTWGGIKGKMVQAS